MNKSAVYKITNIVTQKVYVGSSVNFNKRKNGHLKSLRTNKHHSRKLQNSFNKYGEDSFVFEVIEEVLNVKLLISREQYWINFYNSYHKGYNCSPTAGSTIGVVFSQERLMKMSKALKGKAAWNKGKKNWCSEESLLRMVNKRKENGTYSPWNKGKVGVQDMGAIRKKVAQLNPESNELIKIYDSLTDAGRSLGLNLGSLSSTCKGNQKTCGGFKWMYFIDYAYNTL